jgi:hypothetical protein
MVPMQRSPPENRRFRAKRRVEIRPHYGMPRFAALAALAVIWATAGCFNPRYVDCRITCSDLEKCPSGLMCVLDPEKDYGRCAEPGTTVCPSPNHDAGPDSDAIDSSDAIDRSEVGDPIDGSDADTDTFPPKVLCHNGTCLNLPEAIRTNLVLLLWPSNLPPVGSTVAVWPDQSGNGNHAEALYPRDPTALPEVIPNGVHLNANRPGGGFVVVNKPSLDFGSGDFVIIVVAGPSSSVTPVTFFRKSDGAHENPREIFLDWVSSSSSTGQPRGSVNGTSVVPSGAIPQFPQLSVAAYTLQRSIDHLELSRNGAVIGSRDLAPAGASTSNAADIYLGVTGFVGTPADSIAAVFAIRGSVGSSDLDQLDRFLLTLFATVDP